MSALLLLLAASAAADPAPPPAAKPRVERAVRLSIHKEAKDWEPVSLKAGGDPKSSLTGATLRLRRSKGRLKGDPSRATAFARLHEAKDESWLVVTVVPKALARRRMQIELRFRVVEGYVEDVKAAAVSVGQPLATALDSFELRGEGISFEETFPTSGKAVVSAIDAKPSKSALNAGSLKSAEFPDKDLGFVDVFWSARGLR